MPVSPLRLVKNCFEYAPKDDVRYVHANTRGMYVLYAKKTAIGKGRPHFDVVYVGIASGDNAGVRGRLQRHRRSKGEEWSHFSVFEVWDNIREDEIKELEGLFRHIYRFDAHANRLNVARNYQALMRVRKSSKRDGWMKDARSELPKLPPAKKVGK